MFSIKAIIGNWNKCIGLGLCLFHQAKNVIVSGMMKVRAYFCEFTLRKWAVGILFIKFSTGPGSGPRIWFEGVFKKIDIGWIII